jgi:hypothetical protein
MSNEKPRFFGQLTGVLYKPRIIFSSIEDNDIIKGLGVMIVMVILASYSNIVYMEKIPLEVLSPLLGEVETSQFEGVIGTMMGIRSSISIIIGWITSTLLMHSMGILSKGKGSMRRLFAMHGFASVPSILNQLLRVVDASIIDSATLTSYFLFYQEISSKALKAFLGTNLVNIWGLSTIALLVIAVEENYGVNRLRAFMIVFLPSVIYFIINYFLA